MTERGYVRFDTALNGTLEDEEAPLPANLRAAANIDTQIGTATQTALDLKAPIASPTFTGTVAGITKSMVGLGNVDNTSDANKPISTATQTALDLKAPQLSLDRKNIWTPYDFEIDPLDTTTDYTETVREWAADGLNVKFDGFDIKITDAITTWANNTRFFCDQKRTGGLHLVTSTANLTMMTMTSRSGVVIDGLTIDGGLSGSHTAGWTIRLIDSDNCELINNYAQNSASETFLIRDGSTKNKINGNLFDVQGSGSGHIYLLNEVDENQVMFNHATDSVGGVIWLSGGANNTVIVGNSCDQADYELIGIRYDCNGGVVAYNRPRNCGDNGISVTGSRWSVFGNDCRFNDHNGIGIYGSYNRVFGNHCEDNGTTGGSQYAGIMVQAAFGGLAQSNSIIGNTGRVESGAATEQTYGVRLLGLSYTAWASGAAVTTGDYRYNGSNLYEATTSGTTGATAPVHTSGTVSDDAVSWKFIGTSTGSLRPNDNVIDGRGFKNHTTQLGDSSGRTNYIDAVGTFTPTIAGASSAGTGTYTTQIGRYTRVGDVVDFVINLGWSAHTGTGNMEVHGLPFAAASGTSFPITIWVNGITWGANRLEAQVVGSGTTINMNDVASGGSVSAVAIDTAGTIRISGKYFV